MGAMLKNEWIQIEINNFLVSNEKGEKRERERERERERDMFKHKCHGSSNLLVFIWFSFFFLKKEFAFGLAVKRSVPTITVIVTLSIDHYQCM